MTVTKYGMESNGTRYPNALIVSTFAGLMLAGCVTVEAPDKPIVINLNINIKQEVVYRLDGDAKALIDEQEDIF